MTIIVIKDETTPGLSSLINFISLANYPGMAVIENVAEFSACDDDGHIICGAKGDGDHEDPLEERVKALEKKVKYLMSAAEDRIKMQLSVLPALNYGCDIFGG